MPGRGMVNPPRVAVIIPCFNDGLTLRESLASLEDQELCEVVVVNDGSTDPETVAYLTEVDRGQMCAWSIRRIRGWPRLE